MSEEKHEFREKMKSGLETIDAKIDELKGSINEFGEGAEDELKEQLAALKKRRAHVADNLESLKDASEDSWEELKAGASKAWDDLESAAGDLGSGIKRAFARLNSDDPDDKKAE